LLVPVRSNTPVPVSPAIVPTLVMFGCALVVTVPAVVADVALPALVAYVAFATVPETLAPDILEIYIPLPVK